MRELFATIEKASTTKATVLISGETGTGKELVARAIHYASDRAAAPFVPVNCGGIPEGLLERELFGHVKGAFTGATETRAGFFQTANGGTLFLDEISETSSAMQVKLLRVLQEHEVCLIGDTKPLRLDLRVVAATNKGLSSLAERDRFRQDLYYRLAVITIEVPPLRARNGDVGELVRHFAGKAELELDRPAPTFSSEALEALSAYDWPGNVRELENLVQRVCVMNDGGRVEVSDLPSPMRFTLHAAQNLDRSLAQVERDHVQAVLDHVGGNKSEAARILQISRKTLRDKLKE
jgi:DNA-binding NtrC family response regulator